MIRLKNKKKIALVLSGGGVKAAAFHVGVCIALQEKGFKFAGGTREQVEESSLAHDPMAIKTYVGSSAGAFISALLAAGHSIEDIVASFQMGAGLVKRPTKKSRIKPISYFDIFSANQPKLGTILSLFKRKNLISGGFEAALKNNFKVNGLFTTRSLERYLRKYVLPTNSFSELGAEFYAVATFLDYSRKAIFGPSTNTTKKDPSISYYNDVSISDAVAASMSLPPVFAPYPIKNSQGKMIYYFDGEIRETLSTHVAKDVGADLIIASYSIQPYEYTEEVGSLSQFGLPLIMNQALYQVVEQKIARGLEAREDIRTLISTVNGYFKENGLPPEHGEKLLEIMCRKVNYKRDIDYIYIHPRGENYEMFFVDHFSLNPEILSRIVKIGFKSAINVLRKYHI